MKPPAFPKDFLKHCPKVDEAKVFYTRFSTDDQPFNESEFAECEFTTAGCGLECQNCKLFLTRPFLGHEFDKKWLPVLEKYYKDSAEYAERESRDKDKKTYTFVAWPDEEKFDTEVFDLFRIISGRVEMKFTANGFEAFQEILLKNGITLREVEVEEVK